jgi:hypothetical protein
MNDYVCTPECPACAALQRAKVSVAPVRWQATCVCGWQGRKYAVEQKARTEGLRHCEGCGLSEAHGMPPGTLRDDTQLVTDLMTALERSLKDAKR